MSSLPQESTADLVNSNINMSITAEQANKLLHMQSAIMELVVLNYDHQLILDKLCIMAEELVPQAVASIMLLDESGCKLSVKAGPNLPAAAIDTLNGLLPGIHSGSCANAVYSNEPQFICDTLTDTRWANVRQFARDYTINACWSMPIRLEHDKPIGSLALSSFSKRQPNDFQKQVLEVAAHIASIIFKRQQEERQLWYLAHYDELTDLPNRSLLNLRLDHAVEQAIRKHEQLAVLFMDLDQFKEINDTMGHQAGDEILKQTSKRLLSCLRKEDTLARMGGDEFILLIERIEQPNTIKTVAERMLHEFSYPFRIHHQERLISISIGISTYPEHGKTSIELMQNADTAMYEAKAHGPGCFVFFQAEQKQQLDERVHITADLRKAIQKNQFLLYYQAQFNYRNSHINAVEVLLRWQHPSNGLISPAEFIPITEKMGLIVELGTWVLQTACLQCKQWWDAGHPLFLLAVNVSPKQLRPGFAQQIKTLLKTIEFPCEQLEIEITESLLMENSQEVIQELNEIKKMGICIAMDDFGTGHSSLAQLKHLPISKLKIDRSFVQGIPEDSNDQVIVRTIISMGHTLGLEVVAEGVETDAQRQFLSEQGCDLLQGFLFSQPLPADEFELVLSSTLVL